jgi:HNH endonuclease
MKCLICNAPIDASNDSKEHLIPNAIGGRLKLRGLLCCACNATTGKNWDSGLADQLHPLSLLFAIQRERGDVPYLQVATADGDALYLHGDGSLSPVPVYKVHKEGDETRVEMRVGTLDEARVVLEKLKQRRHPKLDVDKALLSAHVQEKFGNVIRFELPFGGPIAGRAVVKSALCLAVLNGVEACACAASLEYLHHAEAEPCFGFFYEREVILDRPARVPLHCVAVGNCGNDGQLLAYLEYYGVHRIVVRRSDQFCGPDIHCSYSINPVTGEELKLQYHLGL